MQFVLSVSSPEPIYRQIVEQVRRQVTAGHWRAGQELPSVRALAQAHAINPMTVSKAYSLLEADGLLERRRGMGMVIADVRPVRRAADRAALLEPTAQALVAQAQQLGLSRADVAAAVDAAWSFHTDESSRKRA